MATPAPRKRSLPILVAVCLIPAVAAGIVGAMTVGGSGAIVFGALFGAVLGALAILFALFLGWHTHRH